MPMHAGEVDGTVKVCEAKHASASQTVSQTVRPKRYFFFFSTRLGRKTESRFRLISGKRAFRRKSR